LLENIEGNIEGENIAYPLGLSQLWPDLDEISRIYSTSFGTKYFV